MIIRRPRVPWSRRFRARQRRRIAKRGPVGLQRKVLWISSLKYSWHKAIIRWVSPKLKVTKVQKPLRSGKIQLLSAKVKVNPIHLTWSNRNQKGSRNSKTKVWLKIKRLNKGSSSPLSINLQDCRQFSKWRIRSTSEDLRIPLRVSAPFSRLLLPWWVSSSRSNNCWAPRRLLRIWTIKVNKLRALRTKLEGRAYPARRLAKEVDKLAKAPKRAEEAQDKGSLRSSRTKMDLKASRTHQQHLSWTQLTRCFAILPPILWR